MKKLITSLVVLSLVALTGPIQAKETIIFEKNDPVGDEYGPGTYVYPTSEQFKPYEGLFDLLEYKVSRQENRYNFYFKFAEITNPWRAYYGFSHQLIQVYIDNQSGGSVKTFKPGAHVRFEKQHPWDKLLKINGWMVELYSVEDDQNADGRLEEVTVEVKEQVIKVSLPREKIGELEEAYYYVLVGALDGFGYDNYRSVAAKATGWKFGGGTDTDVNPNVLDTLVPEGMEQKKILASYDVKADELATLRAVGPELGLPIKFLLIISFVGVFLFSLLGVVIKFIFQRGDNESV